MASHGEGRARPCTVHIYARQARFCRCSGGQLDICHIEAKHKQVVERDELPESQRGAKIIGGYPRECFEAAWEDIRLPSNFEEFRAKPENFVELKNLERMELTGGGLRKALVKSPY